jgi:hypothetical protein
LNCSQAIIGAFRDKFSLDENSIGMFASYGAGRAPGGDCGALYAAMSLLEAHHQDKIKDCETMFASHAGSTKCREIRQIRKISCVGCVEKAAEFVDKV